MRSVRASESHGLGWILQNSLAPSLRGLPAPFFPDDPDVAPPNRARAGACGRRSAPVMLRTVSPHLSLFPDLRSRLLTNTDVTPQPTLGVCPVSLERTCGIVARACSPQRPTEIPRPRLTALHTADQRPFPRVLDAMFSAFLCLVEGPRLFEVGPGVPLRSRLVCLSAGRR